MDIQLYKQTYVSSLGFLEDGEFVGACLPDNYRYQDIILDLVDDAVRSQPDPGSVPQSFVEDPRPLDSVSFRTIRLALTAQSMFECRRQS